MELDWTTVGGDGDDDDGIDLVVGDWTGHAVDGRRDFDDIAFAVVVVGSNLSRVWMYGSFLRPRVFSQHACDGTAAVYSAENWHHAIGLGRAVFCSVDFSIEFRAAVGANAGERVGHEYFVSVSGVLRVGG